MAKWNRQSANSDLAIFSGDPQVKRELLIRYAIILAVVAMIVAAVGFGIRPAYYAFRNMQIDRNLEAAKAATRVEDWGTARNKARSVLLARPNDFEAYRVWFKALSEMGEPRAYLVAASLFMDPRASREEKLEALGVLARQAPDAVALSAYASMDETMRQEPAALAALSPLLIRRGQHALVEDVLRNVSGTAPPAIRLELLRALCSVPTPERVAEARQILSEMIAADASESALDALIILGETPGGLAKSEAFATLPGWVDRQPKATTLHHLFALHPIIDEAAGATEDIYKKAIERFLDVDPGTVGSWLIRHGQSARAADLLTESARTRPTAYIARLHALLREKRSPEISTLLANPPSGVDIVDLELAKVAAARIMEDKAAETNAWDRALQNAAFDQSRNRFLEIGKYASTLDAESVVDDSWVAAIRVGWGNIPLYQDLQPVFVSLARKSRSEDLLSICRTLLRFEPGNPDLINNYHYLALLHGVIAPTVVAATLEQLVSNHPDRPEFRSALALAYLMDQVPQKAIDQIAFLQDSKRVSPLMLRALEGSSRLLLGESEAGAALLEGISWSTFLRVENLVFYRVLNRLDIQDLPLPPMDQLPPAPDPDNVPAWKRAVERLEKERAQDVLPILPMPVLPGTKNAD